MIVFLIVVLVLLVLLLLYADNNLHGDERTMKKVWNAGYHEKQAVLPNGTKLNYGEGGKSDLPPLLLIHGQGQAWQDYDRVLPALAQKFHVYTVDCHGHGKSSHDASRYTCRQMTDDFIWLIQNVIGRPCVVSGHSSGGILAADVAASSPQDVSALVIEDAPFFCVQPEEMQQKHAFAWLDSFQLIHDFLGRQDADNYYLYYFQNSCLWSLFGNLKNIVAASARKYILTHPGAPLKIWYLPQALLRGLYYMESFDVRFAMTFYSGSWFDGTSQEEILQNVKCPCTYLKAKTGYLLDGKPKTDFAGRDLSHAVLCCANTEADAEKVTALIKNCRRVTTETSDHLIHFKYPDVFVSEIERYSQGQGDKK